MNKIVVGLALSLALALTLFAQTPPSATKDLTDKIDSLYQRGKLVEAIKVAESLVKLEKDSGDSSSYVNALINLGRLKRDYYVDLHNKATTSQINLAAKKETLETALKNADEAEALFRQALQLNETQGKEKTAQTADLKKDLASLIDNHPSGAKTIAASRARIDEAEKLYLESIATNEQTRGAVAAETLRVVLDTGDFYFKYVNFEKALPLYERYLDNYEKVSTILPTEVVRALRPYAKILITTFQDQAATETLKEIETITQRPEERPAADLNLHLRSKDSVAFAFPVIQQFNKESEDFRNRVKLEGRTPTNDRSGMPRMVFVPVKVEVDENGKISKAVADTNDKDLRAKAEAEVLKWTVRPFSYDGTARKMRGIMTYREVRSN